MSEKPFKAEADLVMAHFASHSAVAKALGYDDLRNVYPWTTGIRAFPPEHGVTLEQKSDGKLNCEQICPDQPWMRVKDKAWPHPAGRPVIDHAAKADQQLVVAK